MTDWLPYIDSQECRGCGACVDHCPTNALSLINAKAVLTAPEQCIYCAECEITCPSGAVQLPLMIRRKESTTGA